MASLRMLHGGLGRRAVRPPQLPHLAGDHHFAFTLVSAPQFFLEPQRADLGRNQLQAPLAEVLFESETMPICDHGPHTTDTTRPGQRWSR